MTLEKGNIYSLWEDYNKTWDQLTGITAKRRRAVKSKTPAMAAIATAQVGEGGAADVAGDDEGSNDGDEDEIYGMEEATTTTNTGGEGGAQSDSEFSSPDYLVDTNDPS